MEHRGEDNLAMSKCLEELKVQSQLLKTKKLKAPKKNTKES